MVQGTGRRLARLLQALSARAVHAAVFAAAAIGLLFGGASAARAQTADLVMGKTAPASAAANTDITYTLNVVNPGPDDAVSVQVTDPLPVGITFVSVTAPAGWACSAPPVGNNGNVICEIAT